MVKGDHMVKANIPVLFGWKVPEWGEGKNIQMHNKQIQIHKYRSTKTYWGKVLGFARWQPGEGGRQDALQLGEPSLVLEEITNIDAKFQMWCWHCW